MNEHLLDNTLVLVTFVGWLLNVRAVWRVNRRVGYIYESKINGGRLTYALGTQEHETWRLIKQTILFVSSVGIAMTTSVCLPPESILGRVTLGSVSILMSVSTVRAWIWHGRLVRYLEQAS